MTIKKELEQIFWDYQGYIMSDKTKQAINSRIKEINNKYNLKISCDFDDNGKIILSNISSNMLTRGFVERINFNKKLKKIIKQYDFNNSCNK